MPGNAIGRPSGRAGIAGKRGGMRMHVADIGGGIGQNVRGSGWDESGTLLGNLDGVPGQGAHFSSARNQVRQSWIINGITKDSTGAALGGCTVTLFTTPDNMPRAITVSDDAGAYSFSVDGNSQTRFAVSYKAGSPDVAGTTVNTLMPVLT